MSFYKSSSYLNNFSTSSYYFNNVNNSSSNHSYYNDTYRSYSNLRGGNGSGSSAAPYQAPLYVSSIPFTFSLRKPSANLEKSDKTNSTSKLNTFAQPEINHATISSSKNAYSSSVNLSQINDSQPITKIIPIRKKESNQDTTSSAYTTSLSSPNLNKDAYSTNYSDNHNTFTTTTTTTNNNNKSYPEVQPSNLFNNSNLDAPKSSGQSDLSASAVSNIQLNCTDDLTTQVDYYINEVDNRMICSGRQIELESFELSCKGGLISKCLYINELLNEANMNETNFDSDPVFSQNGKCLLIFNNSKDAEDFGHRHSDKFNVTFQNHSSSSERLGRTQKKSVSFNDESELDDIDAHNRTKSILKSNNNATSNNRPSSQLYSRPGGEPISTRATVGLANSTSFSDLRNEENNLLVSTNTSKKNKAEGYEILTIRAKLKQRVGQNRTKQVELRDIDSIMRNVVTIIQDEFMKQFPSGPSTNAIRSN